MKLHTTSIKPRGVLSVDPEKLRLAQLQGVPRGAFLVDEEALRRAQSQVPRGEFHRA